MRKTMVRKLEPLCDKIGRDRVAAVVHDFYTRLRADPELGALFRAIPDQAGHEERVIGYWWVAMGGRMAEPPVVDMVGRHAPLGLTEAMLQRWLALFDQALQAHLEPELAEQWRQMAEAVGERLRGQVIR
jgi:hemoglobin